MITVRLSARRSKSITWTDEKAPVIGQNISHDRCRQRLSAPVTSAPIPRNISPMKNYLAGAAFAALGTIALAFVSAAITGHDWIGNSVQSRFLVGGIFGLLVGVLAGLPRLVTQQRFGSTYSQTVAATTLTTVGLWAGECLFLPGTNAGFSLFHALAVALVGAWIGSCMWLGNSQLKTN